MENAGRNAADLIESWAAWMRGKKVAASPAVGIVCGRGNNGGDGLVIARHLAMRGFDVSVDLLGNPAGLSPDASVNFTIAREMGLPIRLLGDSRSLSGGARRWCKCDVLVDACWGRGSRERCAEPLAGVIRRMNELKAPLVVAVDVPSGLNADTGEAGEVAVRAGRTVTFLAEKVGFAVPGAKDYVGRSISVVDIGAPLSLDPLSIAGAGACTGLRVCLTHIANQSPNREPTLGEGGATPRLRIWTLAGLICVGRDGGISRSE